MRELTLGVRDLVSLQLQLVLQLGAGAPVPCRIRARVSAISAEGVEVRLLDDIRPLNGYPMRIPALLVPVILTKIEPPAPNRD